MASDAPSAPPRIDDLLNAAVDLHRKGRLAEADRLYAAVLAQDPDHPDALHLSGLVARHAGDDARALDLLTRAVEGRPGFVAALFNLGNFLSGRGRAEDALARFLQALQAQPDYIDARLNAAALLLGLGRPAAAAAQYQALLAFAPDHAAALSNLGMAFRQLRRPGPAQAVYARALRLRPDQAVACSNLGALLREVGDDVAAAAALRVAAALDPGFAAVYANLGAIKYAEGDFETAESGYRRSLSLLADNPELWGNLGSCLQYTGRMAAALKAHRASVALAPSDPETWNRLGVAEQCMGTATAAFNRALLLDPGKHVAAWHRSLARLGTGDLAGGWTDYESGLENGLRGFLSDLPIPLWRGEDLTGATVLVRREQGVGDELMFNSCIPELQSRAGLCVLECSPRLKTLFQRSLPGVLVVETDGLPALLTRLETAGLAPVRQVGLASLPFYFRMSLDAFPKNPAWRLRADPDRRAAWRARLDAAGPGVKIGFGWRSRRVYGKDYHLYSQNLNDWAGIFRTPGATFVSLQYDPSEEELNAARAVAGPAARIVSFPELDLTNDLDGAAALTAACDLVLSTASAVAVMGGALGLPTWLMTLPADWRTHGTDHYPWLPSTSCLIRSWEEDWSRVLGAAESRLRRQVAGA